MSKDLLDRLRSRLSSASDNDRRYERPMNWEEANSLVSMAEEYKERCRKLSEDLTGNDPDKRPAGRPTTGFDKKQYDRDRMRKIRAARSKSL